MFAEARLDKRVPLWYNGSINLNKEVDVNQLIQIKLGPTLFSELRTVAENCLIDNENQPGYLKPNEASYSQKLVDSNGKLELTLDEAKALYNDLYFNIDKFEEWAEDVDYNGNRQIGWYSVARSCRNHMKKLLAQGVETNASGWAR